MTWKTIGLAMPEGEAFGTIPYASSYYKGYSDSVIFVLYRDLDNGTNLNTEFFHYKRRQTLSFWRNRLQHGHKEASREWSGYEQAVCDLCLLAKDDKDEVDTLIEVHFDLVGKNLFAYERKNKFKVKGRLPEPQGKFYVKARD
ncbi:hypothetical protein VNI00_018911 [Paramarasmius palmivorus]|uniref:Uncharacterized protein n=1 Tax=Paramarasmius palmivorus TaxID=297713 RepID=A0AAW0AU91_9AGAR